MSRERDGYTDKERYTYKGTYNTIDGTYQTHTHAYLHTHTHTPW